MITKDDLIKLNELHKECLFTIHEYWAAPMIETNNAAYYAQEKYTDFCNKLMEKVK